MANVHVDYESLNISIRKGEYFLQALRLFSENDLTELFCGFVIVENYGLTPIVKKTCKIFEDNWIVLDLDSNETDLLFSCGENPKNYYWGLILHNKDDYRNTIVPRNFEEKPEFRVYPGFEICT